MAKRNVAHSHKGYGADIDDANMVRMEKGASSQARGQQRRMALLACARDSETLVNMAKTDPEAFDAMTEMILDFHEHAKAMFDVSTSAFARIAMAREMSEAA